MEEHPNQPQRKAAIYARSATSDQEGKTTSIELQIAECRAYAVENGIAVLEDHIYWEVAPGDDIKCNQELVRLLETMKQHLIDVVLVKQADRISRNPIYVGAFLEDAKKLNIEIISITDPFLELDSEYKIGQILMTEIHKVERQKIEERSRRRGRNAKRKGNPPFGYSQTENGLVVNPLEAEIVKQIFTDNQ